MFLFVSPTSLLYSHTAPYLYNKHRILINGHIPTD